MAMVSQLLPHERFIELSDDTINNIWSILYAEMLQSPQIMDHLRGQVQEKVLPALERKSR